MPHYKNELGHGLEDEKMNDHYKKLMSQYKKTMDSSGKEVKTQPHNGVPVRGTEDGPMGGPLMNWTSMLEAMDTIYTILELGDPTSLEDAPIQADTSAFTVNEKEILDKLNKIFTPILVMQGFENEVNPNKITESIEQAGVLTEKNVIQFDDATRMAQLIATCALLLQQQKNTEKFQMYAKAAAIRNQMKLEMQKEEYDAAKALAQKYLVMVSTSNNSPVARDAATSLLPQTQH